MAIKQTYDTVYRVSAWYDLLVTWPFATPLTFAILWQTVLVPLHGAIGGEDLPKLSVYAVLFANFFGTVVVIWAVVRLMATDTRLAIFDGVARLFFSAWMLVALLAGASPLIIGFLVPEFIFAMLQVVGSVRKYSPFF